jgi:hypothetical protein
MFYACNNREPVVHCFTYETGRRNDGPRQWVARTRRSEVEHIWETFDGLFKTLYRQGRRVEELEARVAHLERRLQEREGAGVAAEKPSAERVVAEMPVERAA